jgi:aspartate/methionine/tyrosine aminotransferase
MSLPLGYPQTNGTPELRASIASMYPGASPAHVQVTNGGSEANLITLMHLVQPSDQLVVMMPNYMQVRGLGRALQAEVRQWTLSEGANKDQPRWAPDLDALRALVTDAPRAILICNPNNPTGARLTASELDEICRIAARSGAWVVSDEIYRGAELDGVETPTAWGRYERVIVTSGLSKAFALPGLRIGWVVAPPALIDELWGVHDYTTIAPGAINDRLARIALAPQRRELLLARTRGILRTNYPTLKRWIERRAATLTHLPPEAGAIAFVRYSHRIGSTRLVERIRDEQSVLVVPRRSLRDGRVPAHRFRLRPRAARAGAGTDWPGARLGGRRHHASGACALISRSSASATSVNVSHASSPSRQTRSAHLTTSSPASSASPRGGTAACTPRKVSTSSGRWPTPPPDVLSKVPAAVLRPRSCCNAWARRAARFAFS